MISILSTPIVGVFGAPRGPAEAPGGAKNPPPAAVGRPDPPLWHPILHLGSASGLDAGGSREELRDQNRIWSQAAAGADFRAHSGSVRLRPWATAVLGFEDDYRRYGPGDSTQKTALVPARLELGLAYAAGSPARLSWWGAGPEVPVWSAPMGLFARGGYGHQRADPEGIYLAGPFPMAMAHGNREVGAALLGGGLFGAATGEANAWNWNSRDRVVGGFAELRWLGVLATVVGTIERFPGQSARPDTVLPLWYRPVLFEGRPGQDDEHVRTYGLRLQSAPWGTWTVAAFSQRGLLAGVAPDGTQATGTRRTVAAGAAFASFYYTFTESSSVSTTGRGGAAATADSDAGAAECDLPPEVAFCAALPEPRALRLGVSGLWTSADRNESDDRARGYAGPAAGPSVMGGPLSILLSGPGPGGESAPFMQPRPRTVWFDDASVDPDRTPAGPQLRPDRQNGGLRMGSVHVANVWRPGSYLFQLDLFGNYARYLTGEGYEIIGALTLRKRQDSHLRLRLAATAARYRKDGRQINVWTGWEEPSQTEHYRRFLVLLVWSYE